MNMQKIDLVDELMRKVIFRDDEEAFCQLFYDLFPPLCAFAHRYVEEKETCEDIVQEVFFSDMEKSSTHRYSSICPKFLDN